MKSPMLEAFLKQQKYTDEEASRIIAQEEMAKQENYKKAQQLLSRPQEINGHMNIPSKIKAEDINQKTESHPQLKNYDHSLDMPRKIGLKNGKPFVNEDGEVETEDGLIMGNLTSKDVLNSTL